MLDESKYATIAEAYEDYLPVLLRCQTIYNSILLARIKRKGLTISESKVQDYLDHQQHLALLRKVLVRGSDLYRRVLKEDSDINNYVRYTRSGTNAKKGTGSSCTREEFYKFLLHELKEVPNSYDKDSILNAIELQTFMPLQRGTDNVLIPYQLHLEELKQILETAANKYAFLNQEEDGITIKDKIIALMKFRIPYYVGPLNTSHRGPYTWAVRKEDGPIYPWNFEQKIDLSQSAEKFIRRMTNTCTYLLGEDVLPRHSLLYSEFALLNELNNVRYDGRPLTKDVKEQLIRDTYIQVERKPRVTKKYIANYLKSHNLTTGNGVVSGIDIEVQGDLKSYRDMHRILGNQFNTDMAENIILWITLFGEAKDVLVSNIKHAYPQITQEQIKALKQLNYTGWGRLSHELLTNVTTDDQPYSIITMLRTTDKNLMQLLSHEYGYKAAIEIRNQAFMGKENQSVDYVIQSIGLNPAARRATYQALALVNEITKIRKALPKKIYVEVNRFDGAKKRTNKRKDQLLNLYKNISDEGKLWSEKLKHESNDKLLQEKLYLYYLQLGKCMYTGEPIDISLLFSNHYHVDHIIPRALKKDDSITNKVLVKAEVNAEKSDADYLPDSIRLKQMPMWQFYLAQGLISQEKFNRLTRNTDYTEEELKSFISRQLVETSQSAKGVIEVLKNLYPNTDIVYVKAGNVSDFRKRHKYSKCRSLNDTHHAKDAYLNIVVGRVYSEFFGKFIYGKNTYNIAKEKYNFTKLFDCLITNENSLIWDPAVHKAIVNYTMSMQSIHITRRTAPIKGALHDETVYKAKYVKSHSGTQYLGLKANLTNVAIYGGVKGITISYYTITEVQYNKTGKLEQWMVAIPLMASATIKTVDDVCHYVENHILDGKKYTLSKILYQKLYKHTKIKINGFYYTLGGKSTDAFYIDSACPLLLDDASVSYLQVIERAVSNGDFSHRHISLDSNLELYRVLMNKGQHGIYLKLKNLTSKIEYLADKGMETFTSLSLEDQCKALLEILNLFTHKSSTSNIKNYFDFNASRLKVGAKLTKLEEFCIIEESVTGLIKKTVKIK